MIILWISGNEFILITSFILCWFYVPLSSYGVTFWQSISPITAPPDPRRTVASKSGAANNSVPVSTDKSVPSRDPRAKADQRSSSVVSTKHTSKVSGSSRDPRSSSAHKSRRKETPDEEAALLFKPDVMTKVPPTKIKIDLKVFDANKAKQQPALSRDPRIKARESKAAPKPAKSEETLASILLPNSAFSEVPSSLAKSSASQKVKTSAERKEEIRRELKLVDRKESKRADQNFSSGESSKKSDRNPSPKPRDSSASRKVESKSRSSEQRKSDGTSSYKPQVTPTVPARNTTLDSSSNTSSSADPPSSSSSSDKTKLDDISSSLDSFRNVERGSARRRQIRKRSTPSPEPSITSAAAAGGLKKKHDEGTESDESDHYEANKPKPKMTGSNKGQFLS